MNVNVEWYSLNINNIPAVAAVYGFKYKRQWVYIGQSKNIKQRLNKHHMPFQIAKELSGIKFFYYPIEVHRIRLENHLIKNLQPEWNGSISRNPLGSERYLYSAIGWFCDLDLVNYRQFIEVIVDQVNRFPDRIRSMGLLPEHIEKLKSGDLRVLYF